VRVVKAAVIVLAGTEAREGLGRVVNALVTANELEAAGNEPASATESRRRTCRS
jgi:hypothetical protein